MPSSSPPSPPAGNWPSPSPSDCFFRRALTNRRVLSRPTAVGAGEPTAAFTLVAAVSAIAEVGTTGATGRAKGAAVAAALFTLVDGVASTLTLPSLPLSFSCGGDADGRDPAVLDAVSRDDRSGLAFAPKAGGSAGASAPPPLPLPLSLPPPSPDTSPRLRFAVAAGRGACLLDAPLLRDGVATFTPGLNNGGLGVSPAGRARKSEVCVSKMGECQNESTSSH